MILLIVLIALCFGAGAILGAPYLPVLSRDVGQIMELAEVGPGTRVLDLGSGDGRLLRAAARRGATAVGYEINPVLYIISWLWCWPWRNEITLHLGNYWTTDWPRVDVVVVFLIPRLMGRLGRRLEEQITRPTTVVSYAFELPNHHAERSTANCWRYRLPNLNP